MHNPRGSNNRCDERTNDRNNANRLFDSQNNAAGGYAVPCQDSDLSCYNMKYYTESYLDIRFTTQHACGIQNQCEIIIQYSCDMRNGEPTNSLGNTCTRTMPNNNQSINDRSYGYHETYDSYKDCTTRKRQFNLYTAEQVLRGSSSIYTRQNPNGNRFGFECPEERDYYPYWNYSQWIDIAVMTSNISMCDYYMNNTNNINLICSDINHTMVNRLGATYEGTSESSFKWMLPAFSNNNCVLRLRYNISLPSELPWFANSSYNTMHRTDPLILVDGRYVRLALSTDQLPRTFEDRSYTFDIIQKPSKLTGSIYNINVQGKRGNIAQVRNCFEYDYVPNNITIYDTDYVHFQWVGSDFNPLGNDGEGRVGTDRSNLVDITDYFGYNRTVNNTFIPSDLIDTFVYLNQSIDNCYTFDDLVLNKKILDTQSVKNCALLNNASIYFNSRIFKITLGTNETNKTYRYMSTRNNNFSNRNQKGIITVIKNLLLSVGASTSNSDNNGLTPSYIVLIIFMCIAIVAIGVVVVRRYTVIKKKSHEIYNNVKRSFASQI